jgi:hypothetical protein
MKGVILSEAKDLRAPIDHPGKILRCAQDDTYLHPGAILQWRQ